MIKHVKPTLDVPKSVAVVGNSGRLKDTNHGTEIDSHDYVIRFNRATTDGWEEKAGSKTSLRVCNPNVFNCGGNKKPHITKTRYGQDRFFVRKLENTRLLVCIKTHTEKLLNNVHSRFKIDESNEVYAVDTSEFIKALSLNASPSAGVTMLKILIDSNIIPTVYGFDFDDRIRDHYWHYRSPNAPCHNITSEKELLNKWDQEGSIVLRI